MEMAGFPVYVYERGGVRGGVHRRAPDPLTRAAALYPARAGCGEAGQLSRGGLVRVLGELFLKHAAEEVAAFGRRADMQAGDAVLDEAEIAFPAEVLQHEAQAFDFRGRQVRVVDIEDLAGGVGERLLLARLGGHLQERRGLDERTDRQRLEGLIRLQLGVEAARFEGDIGERP